VICAFRSYTLEATFGGTSLPGSRKDTHLSMRDLESMGYHFCDTLLDYCDPDSSKRDACMRELQDRMKRQILKKLRLQGARAAASNQTLSISRIASGFLHLCLKFNNYNFVICVCSKKLRLV